MNKKFLIISSMSIVLVISFFVIYWYYNTFFLPEESLCLEKAKEYLTKKYRPSSYSVIKKEEDNIFFWEKNGDTIACKSDYENKTFMGWTFMILSSVNFGERSRMENITGIFFEKMPVVFNNYTCNYLGNYSYLCQSNKILDEGLYIYRIFGYNLSFDTFDYILNKKIENLKTEIYFCYLTNENKIWKEGHYTCLL